MLPHPVLGYAKLSITVDVQDTTLVGNAQYFVDPAEHTSNSGLRHGSGPQNFEQYDLIYNAVPILAGPAAQMSPSEQPSFIVVRAKVGRSGVRNVDGDDGNIALQILSGNGGSDGLIGLELDDQIDGFTNQIIGITQGDLGVIPVIDHDQFDLGALGRAHQTRGNFTREGRVLAVPGVSDAVAAACPQIASQPILIDANFFDQVARVQRIEQAEA